MTDNRILIISYLFPPMGGIGVQRALSLAKYLPNCQYEVHVLKAMNAGGPVRDPDLVRQIPSSVTVHSAFTPEIPFSIRQTLWAALTRKTNRPNGGNGALGRLTVKQILARKIRKTFCPEPEILWAPFALRKARQIIKKHKIKVVLVTVPPFSALVVGSALKREFPSLTLVSDFRDEWLTFYLKDFEFQNSEYTRQRAETIEREAVEHSDLVVAVNRSSRVEIRRRYPEQPDAKFVVIPNGYDPELFAGIEPRPTQSPRMVVTHVGTIYKTASPRFYLDAVDELPDEIRCHIETRFVGRISESERDLFAGRKSMVRVLGFLPQAEALKYLQDTDFLLLTMTNEISVPGKIFEYMAARKPILTITPLGSETDHILAETGSGVSAPPDDRNAIKTMLRCAVEAWKQGSIPTQLDSESVRRYERPRLAQEYGTLMSRTETRIGDRLGFSH